MIKYVTIFNWALLPDDAVLHETAEALEIAKQFGDDFQLANAEFTHGLALIPAMKRTVTTASNYSSMFVRPC